MMRQTAIRRISPQQSRKKRSARAVGFWLTMPNSIGLLIFYLIPIVIALGLAFYRWNVFQPPEFLGFENFRELVKDPVFYKSLGNTLKLAVVVVPVQIGLALAIAVGLNRPARGIAALRTLYFLPVVTSTVAAAAVFNWIFQTKYGALNIFLNAIGLGQPNWLSEPGLVLIPIGTVMIWQRLGFDIILFIAGLQAIPRSLYEACTVDGASPWQRFRSVTVPQLAPTFLFVGILETIIAFQVFDQVLIMTGDTVLGGVGGSASTLSFYLYKSGFLQNRFGYAATIALAQFAMILAITGFQAYGQKKWVDS